MMTPTEGRAQRKALMREIARDLKRKERIELRELRDALKTAHVDRRAARKRAKELCRQGRRDVRARIRVMRQRVREELRAAVKREKDDAKAACVAERAAARELGSVAEERRAKFRAERDYRRTMRQIERSNQDRQREARRAARPRREAASESDDEVRGNIPPEMVSLFERVKDRVKGSARMTRTEAFLHYAEEHPDEVLASIDDKTDALIRELEAKERRAALAYTRPVPRATLREAVAGRLPDAPF